MNKKFNEFVLLLLLLLLLVLLFPGVSGADWYIGTGVGKTSIDMEIYDSSGPPLIRRDYSDTSYKLFGGWTFTPSLALEFGYADLGEYKRQFTQNEFTSDVNLSASAFFGGLAGLIELGKRWNFIGKLGLAYWDAEMKYNNTAPFADSGNDTGIDPAIGLGFQYQLPGQSFAIRVEWEQFLNIGENVSFKNNATSTNTLNGQDISSFGVYLSHTF